MNLLYCGDVHILDGLVISILSILKNTQEEIHVNVLTMRYQNEKEVYQPLSFQQIKILDEIVKQKNPKNFVHLIDVTEEVMKCLPQANRNTWFTPYCMLRLYADSIPEIPDKVLYLDNDVVCLKNPKAFYQIDNTNYELVGVLDYYGCHFYKKNPFQKHYMNSGVLLLNLPLIKKTGLFQKCREMCRDRKMLLPDQSALNKYCQKRLLVSRIYNEQKQETEETVFRHFSTTFKFWPHFATQTIKPWHIEALHDILKVHCFDDVLEEYQKIMIRMNEEKAHERSVES